MHHGSPRLFVALISVALASAFATPARCEVQVELTAHRIVKDAQGHEQLASGDHAKPGELIEYRAIYRNDGSAGVRKLVATLPIPQGMEYIAATAAPTAALASRDGKTFAAMPLKRTVKLSDGRSVVREVPLSEYRALRWTLGELPAKADRTVRARVRVAPLVSSNAGQH